MTIENAESMLDKVVALLAEAEVPVHHVDPEQGLVMIANPIGDGEYYSGAFVHVSPEDQVDLCLEAEILAPGVTQDQVEGIFNELFAELAGPEMMLTEPEWNEDTGTWSRLLVRNCADAMELVEGIVAALEHGLQFELTEKSL